MSLKQHIDEMNLKIVGFEKEKETFLADMEKGKVELASLNTAILVKDEMIVSLNSVIETGKAELAKIKADYEATIESLKKENGEQKSEIEQAKKAFENPAFADAVIKGEKEIKSGDSKEMDLKELEKQLMAIKDPAKKTAFYRKYFEKK